MPLTTLDANTALVLIDLQQGIVALSAADAAATVLKHSVALARAFRERRLPVVLVNVAKGAPGRTEQPPRNAPAPGWAELMPELDPQAQDIRITKQCWGAFTNTELEAKLRALGVTQVVVAGIATSMGVESTARAAYERGFNVTLATDAMTDMNPVAHENSISQIFPKLGETGTTQQIIDLLGSPTS